MGNRILTDEEFKEALGLVPNDPSKLRQVDIGEKSLWSMNWFRCPHCCGTRTDVYSIVHRGDHITRQWKCLECGKTFSTVESVITNKRTSIRRLQ